MKEHVKFAWLPKKMTSGKVVWLSKYFLHVDLFDRRTGRAPVTSFDFRWTETPQEKTWRLLKEQIVHNRNVWNNTDLTQQDRP